MTTAKKAAAKTPAKKAETSPPVEKAGPKLGDVWSFEAGHAPVEITRPDGRVLTAYPVAGRVSHVLDVVGEYTSGAESVTVEK